MAISLPVRKPPSERVPGKAAWRLCAAFEGLSLNAYPDPGSPRAKAGRMKPEQRPANWKTLSGEPWAIGYGHTGGVKEGDTCTLFQADAWLTEDLAGAAQKVRDLIRVPLTQGEFDALTSMAFNLKGGIAPSMRACLNGGRTDKGVEMAPGSYGSALQQFPRNCRAAGVPMLGLLRRRLAEACIFSDLPWEAACSINIVRLELDANGNPDPYGTTSLEETLLRARQDVPILRPDVSDVITQPWPEPKPDAIVTVIEDKPRTHITDDLQLSPLKPEIIIAPKLPTFEEELILDQPAASDSGPDANGAELVRPDLPDVQAPKAEENTNIGSSKPVSPESTALDPTAPQPSKVQTPASPLPPALEKGLPPPKPPPIIAPKSIDIRSIPYGEVDPSNGAKNMTDSTRFVGMLIVAGGSLVQVLAAREVVSSTAGAIFFDLSRDPVIVALIAGGVIWAIGSVTKMWGRKVITKGMVEAKEVLK